MSTMKRKSPGDPTEQESTSSPPKTTPEKAETLAQDTESRAVVDPPPMQSRESINDSVHETPLPKQPSSTKEATSISLQDLIYGSPVIECLQSAQKEEKKTPVVDEKVLPEEKETNHVGSHEGPVSQQATISKEPSSSPAKERSPKENTPKVSFDTEALSGTRKSEESPSAKTDTTPTHLSKLQHELDELSFPDSTPGSKVHTPSPTKVGKVKEVAPHSDGAGNPSPIPSPTVQPSHQTPNETAAEKASPVKKSNLSTQDSTSDSKLSDTPNTLTAIPATEGVIKSEEESIETTAKPLSVEKASESKQSSPAPSASATKDKETTPASLSSNFKSKKATKTIIDFFKPKTTKASPTVEESKSKANESPLDFSDDSDLEVTPPMKLSLLGCYKVSNFVQRLCVLKGSVLDFGTDPYLVNPTSSAIVNAANEGCLGGGGVDGAISAAGGDVLYEARRALPLQRKGVRCPTGRSVLTSAPGNFGSLHVRNVIHAVGPNYHYFEEEEEKFANRLLRSAYATSIELAHKNRIQNIGFSLLSAGIFRGALSLEEVLTIGLEGIQMWKPSTEDNEDGEAFLPHVYLCAFTDRECTVLMKACDQMFMKIENEEHA